jgi:NLR family CARD domain-containing protein 3
MGEALSMNNKLEVLIMRENKIRWNNYCNFWQFLLPNTTIQKINLMRTDLTDRVLEKMVKYLEVPNVSLVDLDISKNNITDVGLKTLCGSLKINTSLKFLNLSGNKIKEEGLNDLVEYLIENKNLQELSLGSNTITNEGLSILSRFLPSNKTLSHLEISKNAFSDVGFE